MELNRPRQNMDRHVDMLQRRWQRSDVKDLLQVRSNTFTRSFFTSPISFSHFLFTITMCLTQILKRHVRQMSPKRCDISHDINQFWVKEVLCCFYSSGPRILFSDQSQALFHAIEIPHSLLVARRCGGDLLNSLSSESLPPFDCILTLDRESVDFNDRVFFRCPLSRSFCFCFPSV